MSRKADKAPAACAAREAQDGDGPQRTPRGADKPPEGKQPKFSKAPKEQPRDMLFYTQRVSAAVHSTPNTQSEDMEMGGQDDTLPLESSLGLGPNNAESPGDENTQPTLTDILIAVHKCTAAVGDLKVQFGGLAESVSLLRQDLQKIRERTTAAEGRISDIEDQLPPLARDTRAAAQQAAQNTAKTDDIENRLRRNNVRIVGLPEKVEGRDPTTFVEDWLLETFGKEAFSAIFAVERAHRTPPRPPQPGNRPRSMLARILNYRDREVILRLARERGAVQYNGSRVSFYPDFSAEVQRKRLRFTDVKQRLQRLQITYAMLYPAKLRVTVGGQVSFFETATEAAAWLDHNEQNLRHRRQDDRGEGR